MSTHKAKKEIPRSGLAEVYEPQLNFVDANRVALSMYVEDGNQNGFNLLSTEDQPTYLVCAWAQLATIAKTSGSPIHFERGPKSASGVYPLKSLYLPGTKTGPIQDIERDASYTGTVTDVQLMLGPPKTISLTLSVLNDDDNRTYTLLLNSDTPELPCAWAQMAIVAKAKQRKVKFDISEPIAELTYNLSWLSLPR